MHNDASAVGNKHIQAVNHYMQMYMTLKLVENQ